MYFQGRVIVVGRNVGKMQLSVGIEPRLSEQITLELQRREVAEDITDVQEDSGVHTKKHVRYILLDDKHVQTHKLMPPCVNSSFLPVETTNAISHS